METFLSLITNPLVFTTLLLIIMCCIPFAPKIDEEKKLQSRVTFFVCVLALVCVYFFSSSGELFCNYSVPLRYLLGFVKGWGLFSLALVLIKFLNKEKKFRMYVLVLFITLGFSIGAYQNLTRGIGLVGCVPPQPGVPPFK